MSTSAKRIAMLAVAAMFTAGVTTEVMGAEYNWASGAGAGNWGDSSNWVDDAGDPTSAPTGTSGNTDAMINQSDADVTLDGTHASGDISLDERLYLDNGTLTVDYSGNTFESTWATTLSAAGNDATLNIKNGTLTSKGWNFARHSGSTMTVNMEGGTLTNRNSTQDNIIGDSEGYGTFNMYGGNVSFAGPLYVSNGTFRAWLGSDFNALQAEHLHLWGGSEATLDVGLPGGVMQSSTDSFNLIEYDTGVNNTWDNTPNNLWTTNLSGDDSTPGAASATLDGGYQKGTLDPSNIGDSAPGSSSVYGFIEWDNQENATATELLLDFAWDGTGSESDTWDSFIADLGDAGYTVLDQNFDETSPWAQLELELAGEATEYFTWDLSEYTGSAQLQVDGIQVVPEPSTLVLLGLAGLLLMKRRRL